MTTRFWLQTQTPNGNWADNLGAEEQQRCVDHGVYLQEQEGATVRVIERTDVVVWTPATKRPFPANLTRLELVDALARAGYKHERTDFDPAGATLVRRTNNGATAVYRTRFNGEEGWETGQLYAKFVADQLHLEF